MITDFAPIALTPFHAAVFDMDGTLLDTEAYFKSIVFEVADELGYVMTDAIHRAMVGSSNEATRGMLISTYGVSFPYAVFDDRCRVIMHERSHEGVPVKQGAFEFLTRLRENNIPIAVATSSRREHAEKHLSTAGLYALFDTVVTRDDVTNPKPHPEPYLLAAQRLGVDPSLCLALEDSNVGVRAAHAAGMQTIMVPDMVEPDAHIHSLGVSIMESLVHVHEAAFRAK